MAKKPNRSSDNIVAKIERIAKETVDELYTRGEIPGETVSIRIFQGEFTGNGFIDLGNRTLHISPEKTNKGNNGEKRGKPCKSPHKQPKKRTTPKQSLTQLIRSVLQNTNLTDDEKRREIFNKLGKDSDGNIIIDSETLKTISELIGEEAGNEEVKILRIIEPLQIPEEIILNYIEDPRALCTYYNQGIFTDDDMAKIGYGKIDTIKLLDYNIDNRALDRFDTEGEWNDDDLINSFNGGNVTLYALLRLFIAGKITAKAVKGICSDYEILNEQILNDQGLDFIASLSKLKEGNYIKYDKIKELYQNGVLSQSDLLSCSEHGIISDDEYSRLAFSMVEEQYNEIFGEQHNPIYGKQIQENDETERQVIEYWRNLGMSNLSHIDISDVDDKSSLLLGFKNLNLAMVIIDRERSYLMSIPELLRYVKREDGKISLIPSSNRLDTIHRTCN